MKKVVNVLFLFIVFFLSPVFPLVFFKGNTARGFTFPLFSKLLVDPLRGVIFTCNGIQGDLYNSSQGYAVSVYDIKNDSGGRFAFFPLLSRAAIVNGVLEDNPLYGASFTSFSLLLGVKHEPKYYPLLVPSQSAKVYLINDVDFYSNEKNKIISTDELLGESGDPGSILDIAPGANSFLAAVVNKGTSFAGSCELYNILLKEDIVPIPGGGNYITLVSFTPSSGITSLTPSEPSLCCGADTEVSLENGSFTLHGMSAINKKYIGLSGQGVSGIKSVLLFNESVVPILSKEGEAAITGNNIVVTNQSAIPLYTHYLSSLRTSTRLSYLLVQGGENDLSLSRRTVYSLPLISSDIIPEERGMLASVNSEPLAYFSSQYPYFFLGLAFTETPAVEGDLYTRESRPAKVGGGALEAVSKETGDSALPMVITSVEGYKDSVFVGASFEEEVSGAIGGVFHSQALLDEKGMIAAWTPWGRKDSLIGNIANQAYVPSLGRNVAVYKNFPQSIVIPTFSNESGFACPQDVYAGLPCHETGIEKIIDIPWQHRAMGLDTQSGLPDLSPSYFIAVGYNTVFLQQTAKNNGFLPLSSGSYLLCRDGTAAEVASATDQTVSMIFTGGELSSAGSLFTADIAFSDTDAWLLAAGEGGVFILAEEDGSGFGAGRLKSNFTGVSASMKWFRLGDFSSVKKVVANDERLYIVCNKAAYAIHMNKENIAQKKVCKYYTLIEGSDIKEKSLETSFSDGLFSDDLCLLATSRGLFCNDASEVSIRDGIKIVPQEIILPESFGAVPVFLSPSTSGGVSYEWAVAVDGQVSANIYLMATSIAQHMSKVYRLVARGSGASERISLLNNYFIKDYPSYYYSPEMELFSVACDGASLFSHGTVGNSLIFRSYIGVLNPFLSQGVVRFKNEYNFFELASKAGMYLGFPTYISGNGSWMFSSQSGFQGIL
jgi:hypothetical protein